MVRSQILVSMMQVINGVSNAFDVEGQAPTNTFTAANEAMSTFELNLLRVIPNECDYGE